MRLLTLSLGLTQFASAAGSRKVVHIGPIARAVADPDRLAEAEEVEAPLEPLDLQDQRERHLQRSGDAEESQVNAGVNLSRVSARAARA